MTFSQKYKPPYLGLDWGEKRIGVGISPDGTRVFPRKHISYHATVEAVQQIASLVQEEGVETVVLGLPVSLSGEENEMTRVVRTFSDSLTQSLGIPIVLHDERLTSKTAKQFLQQGADASKDSLSAQILLQSFLGV